MPKRRKGSRSGFDYATYADSRGFHRGAAPGATGAAPGYYAGAYTMQLITPFIMGT